MVEDDDPRVAGQPILRPWASWLTIAILVAAAVLVLWHTQADDKEAKPDRGLAPVSTR